MAMVSAARRMATLYSSASKARTASSSCSSAMRSALAMSSPGSGPAASTARASQPCADWTSASARAFSWSVVGGSYSCRRTHREWAIEIRAALTAARYSELFAGAILRKAVGRDSGGPIDLMVAGGLNGLPAYCICGGKTRDAQVKFAQKLKAANAMTEIVEDDKFLGDAAAITAWLAKITDAKAGVRALQPRRIEYMVHDSSFQRHYWINVLEYDASTKPAPMLQADADRAKNEIRLDVTGISRLELFLNDAVADLNKPLKVFVIDDGREMLFFEGPVERSLGTLLAELVDSNQPWRIYAARFVIDVGALRAKVEEQEAEQKAAAEAKKNAEDEAKKKKKASVKK